MSVSLPAFRPVSLGGLDLRLDPVDADAVAAGAPSTGFVDLISLRSADVGVWEMTVGGMFDTETDEVFVVLSGAASVTPIGLGPTATGEPITLRPGDLCRLTAGMRTRWDVTSALRKLYIVGAPATPDDR